MMDDDDEVNVDARVSSELEKKLAVVGVGCDLRNKDITVSPSHVSLNNSTL